MINFVHYVSITTKTLPSPDLKKKKIRTNLLQSHKRLNEQT
jgi:hypothetical protein